MKYKDSQGYTQGQGRASRITAMANGLRVGFGTDRPGGRRLGLGCCIHHTVSAAHPLGIKVTRFQIVVNVFIGHIDIGLAVCLMVRVGILRLPKVLGRRARIRGGLLLGMGSRRGRMLAGSVVETATAGRGSGRWVGRRYACHRSRSEEARTRATRRCRVWPLGKLHVSLLLLWRGLLQRARRFRRQLFLASGAKEKGRPGACHGRRRRGGHVRGDGACGGPWGCGLFWLGRTTAKGKGRSRACRSRRRLCGGCTTPRQERGRLLFGGGQQFLVLAAKQSPQAPTLGLLLLRRRRFHGAPRFLDASHGGFRRGVADGVVHRSRRRRGMIIMVGGARFIRRVGITRGDRHMSVPCVCVVRCAQRTEGGCCA